MRPDVAPVPLVPWADFAERLVAQGDATGRPGTRHEVLIHLAETADGVPVGVPAILINGARPGPRVWIHGSIHGDEVLSTQAVIEVARAVPPDALAGRLLLIPALNATGFRHFARESPYDGADMNRIWDKDPHSLGYTTVFSYFWIQRARRLLDAFRPDWLLDMHDGGLALDIMSHVLYPAGAETYAPQVADVARASGMKVIWRHEGLFFAGSSPGEAHSRSIPGFIIESGGTGDLREADIREMVEGTLNVLRRIGAVPGEVTRRHDEQLLMTKGNWLRAEHGGIFHRVVALGQAVRRGDLIGTVTNLFGGTVEEITSPADGIVFGIRRWGFCNVGDYISNVGVIASKERGT